MFDSKLKKIGKNIILGFFTGITLLLTLLSLFNNAYLSWDEHTTIVADKPFYLLTSGAFISTCCIVFQDVSKIYLSIPVYVI